jgi:hypothetical protein
MATQLLEDLLTPAEDEDNISVHSEESDDDEARLIEILDDPSNNADPHRLQTARQRRIHSPDELARRVRVILKAMKDIDVNLPLFLSSLLWES